MKFIEMANFDIIPVEDIYPTIFDMPEGEPYNEVLGEFEFDETYFVYNVGSPIIIMLLIVIVMIALLVNEYIPRCRNQRLK